MQVYSYIVAAMKVEHSIRRILDAGVLINVAAMKVEHSIRRIATSITYKYYVQ